MKKFLHMAVAAIAALSSCSNDDIVNGNVNGNANGNGNAPVFTATIEGDATTRTAIAEGSEAGKKKVNWSNADQININGSLYSTTSTSNTADFSLVDGQTAAVADAQGKYMAIYPAALYNEGTYTLPATQTYAEGEFNAPMYAESTTTELAFKNICGVLAITIPSTQVEHVTSIVVSSDKQMNGAFNATAAGELTFATKTLVSADMKATLNCCDEHGSYTIIPNGGSKTFYVSIPANTYDYLQIKVIANQYGAPKTMRTKAASISVERNKIYEITFADNNYVDPNLLTGVFSISADGDKKVQFTKGNLWCNTTTSPVTYGFESTQNSFPTTWSTDHIGYFYWTSWTDYCSGTAAYMPYATSYSCSSQSAEDEFWCGETHKLTIAGTEDLYALKQPQWQHIFNIRTNASSLYKLGVSVTTSTGTAENCLIIAPDDYDYTNHPLKQSYTAEEWAAAEELGLVCLPAAGACGYSSSGGFNSQNTDGYYWTSTTSSEYTNEAYSLTFMLSSTKGPVKGFSSLSRNTLRTLRLVKTVE